MKYNPIYVVGIVIVGLGAFCAGVYLTAAGYIPQGYITALRTAPIDTVSGTVTAHTAQSLTINMPGGISKTFAINPQQVQVVQFATPVPKSLGDITIGSDVLVFISNGSKGSTVDMIQLSPKTAPSVPQQ